MALPSTVIEGDAYVVSIALSLSNFIVETLKHDNDLLTCKPNGELERIFMTELANVTPAPVAAAE